MSQNDIYRATATFTMPGSTVAQWVWHYKQIIGGTPTAQQIADAVRSHVGQAFNEIEDHVIDTVIGDTLDIALWDTTLKQFDTIAQSDLSGADGQNAIDEMLPHMDSGVVTFLTGVGRSIGKKFVFGLVETAQSESVAIGAVVTALAAFATIFIDTVTAGGIDIEPGNFNLATELFRLYTGTVQANARLGPQTRRRPGIGI